MKIDRDSVLAKTGGDPVPANDMDLRRGTVPGAGGRAGDLPGLFSEKALRVEFFGDEIERILEIDTLTGEMLAGVCTPWSFRRPTTSRPGARWSAPSPESNEELEERLQELRSGDKLLEAQRLEQRTRYRPGDDA